MSKAVMIAMAILGAFVLGGCTTDADSPKCTSNNAGNNYKCCQTGVYDADGECND